MTITIVARDAKEGLLGIAQATGPLSVGGKCPFIRANVGAISTQAYTNSALGPLGIELLSRGHSPEKVLKDLRESDPYESYRQIGIVDRNGRSAVFTGADNKPFCGAIAGENFVVMGNYLKTDQVVTEMHRAWLDSEGDVFEKRLLASLTAGRDEGGDAGGHRSSCLIVYETETYARTDLRVDFTPKGEGLSDAIDALAVLLEPSLRLIEYYRLRAHEPSSIPGWMDWLEQKGTPFRE